MQSNPLVSVVVPVYNMGKQLKKSINRILNQTYENIEVLLVDDGSKDNTFEVCCELEKANSRVKCFHQVNSGAGPARNKGIENAEGKYIFFADADDEMNSKLIERAVFSMEENECDLAVFGFKRLLPDGNEEFIEKLDGEVICGDEIRHEYHRFYEFNDSGGIQGAPWNKMFRLDYIRKYNIEYPPMRRHQDDVFIMRYVDITDRVVFIKEPLYTYHANGRGMLFDKFPENYFDIVSERNRYAMQYIARWNSENSEVIDLICRGFVNGACQALIVSFNPKFGYTIRERYGKIKEISKRFMTELPNAGYCSNSNMFRLMKKEHYAALYAAARLALRKYYR